MPKDLQRVNETIALKAIADAAVKCRLPAMCANTVAHAILDLNEDQMAVQLDVHVAAGTGLARASWDRGPNWKVPLIFGDYQLASIWGGEQIAACAPWVDWPGAPLKVIQPR